MSCLSSIGYRGVLKFKGNTVPFTSVDVNTVSELFTPTLIGYGNSTYRSPYNYTIARTFVTGNFNTEIYNTGSYGAAISALVNAAVEGTVLNSNDIAYSPSGGSAISTPSQGKGYITGFNLTLNSGQISTISFNFVCSDYDNSSPGSASLVFENSSNIDNQNPVPWYYNNIVMSGSGDDSNINNSCTSFTLSLNNNSENIFGLNGESAPTDIRLGTINVTGSLSYYDNSGNFNDLNKSASLSVDVGSVNLTMPHIVFTNTGSPNQSLNSLVLRTCSFMAFGFNEEKCISIG